MLVFTHLINSKAFQSNQNLACNTHRIVLIVFEC